MSGKRSKSYDNRSIFPLSVCAILKFSKRKPNFEKNEVILKHRPISGSSRTWTVSLYSEENRPREHAGGLGVRCRPRPTPAIHLRRRPRSRPLPSPAAGRARHPLAPPAALPAARCRRCPGPLLPNPGPHARRPPAPPGRRPQPQPGARQPVRAPGPQHAAQLRPGPHPQPGARQWRRPRPRPRPPSTQPTCATGRRRHRPVPTFTAELRRCASALGARAHLRPGAGPARGATAATANGCWRAGRAAPGARRAGPAFFEALGFPRNHFARRRRRPVVPASSGVRSGGPGSVRRNSRGPRGRPTAQVKVRAGGGYQMAEVKPVRTEAGSQMAEVRAVGGWREGVKRRDRGRRGGQIAQVKARVAGVQR